MCVCRTVAFTGEASEAVQYALRYLGPLVKVQPCGGESASGRNGIVGEKHILHPVLQLPDVFDLLHHANQVKPLFALEAVVGVCVCTCIFVLFAGYYIYYHILFLSDTHTYTHAHTHTHPPHPPPYTHTHTTEACSIDSLVGTDLKGREGSTSNPTPLTVSKEEVRLYGCVENMYNQTN